MEASEKKDDAKGAKTVAAIDLGAWTAPPEVVTIDGILDRRLVRPF